MATYELPLNSATVSAQGKNISGRPLIGPTEDMNNCGSVGDGPSILIIFAYFLGLASIAVVAISGQFPWFTLGPAIVLLMVLHCRRIEAKFPPKVKTTEGKKDSR